MPLLLNIMLPARTGRIPVAVRSKAWVCTVHLLELCVRILPATWMSVLWTLCVVG